MKSSHDVSDPRCLTYTPRSATDSHFSAVKISLHQPLRLSCVFTVHHDLDGAILGHRLPHEWPLQWGRNGMKDKEIGESVFVNPPPLSHSHSRIGHETPLTHTRNESRMTFRLQGAATLDPDLDGAILGRWCAAAQERRLPARAGSTSMRTTLSSSTAIGSLNAKERRVFPTAP